MAVEVPTDLVELLLGLLELEADLDRDVESENLFLRSPSVEELRENRLFTFLSFHFLLVRDLSSFLSLLKKEMLERPSLETF